MRRSYHNVCLTPAEDQRRYGEQCGYAAMLMMQSPLHLQYTLDYFYTVITSAIFQKRIRFYFNEDGLPVGYVVWATLAEDVERRVLSTGEFILHESEWNEGDSLWVVDLVAPSGNLKYILRDLRDSVFRDYGRVRYWRRKKQNSYAREIERNPRRAFFKSDSQQPSTQSVVRHV